MPSLSEKDRDSLDLLLEVLDKINLMAKDMKSAHDLEANFVYQDAILMNFILIGECIKRLSRQFKETKSEVEWQKIKNLRNKVSHDYWGVDVEMIWQIMQTKLPQLHADIRRFLDE